MPTSARLTTVALLAAAALTAAAAKPSAVATITPAASAATRPADRHVTGTVTFTQGDGTVTFVADVDGFAPSSTHGFHIHEKGDLSDPALLKAGGHYNPTHQPHGGPTSEHHHAGDMGNLTADATGHAHLTGTLADVSLGGPNDLLGRSVIIHAKADDLHTQPSGDSGGRVAGGVIR